VELSDVSRALREVDIVVASTSAPHAIVTPKTLEEAFPGGVHGPLLIIDIAIPRDVDPAVGEEPNVFLYNVDDLRKIVDETLEKRKDSTRSAEAIVGKGAEEFLAWYSALEVVPVIRSLRARGEAIRDAEVERLLGRLAHLPEGERALVDAFSRRLLNKLLHEPTTRAREGAAQGRADEVIHAARLLFGEAGTGLAGEDDAPEDPDPDGDRTPPNHDETGEGE
jgi:glutamyl-tRNA reductase